MRQKMEMKFLGPEKNTLTGVRVYFSGRSCKLIFFRIKFDAK